MKKSITILLIILSIAFLYIMYINQKADLKAQKISIAEQYGLGYAPLQIMKEKAILEKKLDNVEINWQKLGNTTAIREAIIAGNLDIGFVAIPPFLIGKDKGMNWKIMSGISQSPLGLITYKDSVKSLEDLQISDKIALPQPGSIQHILLAMASQKMFQDAQKFDNRLVTMKHPDGMNALLTGREITAHFTSPPYIFKELAQENLHQILSGEEALGGQFTFIVGVCSKDFYGKNLQLYQIFLESLKEAINYINENPRDSATILAESYNLTDKKTYEYITHPDMKYSQEIKGLDEFLIFMNENNYISLYYDDIGELIWEVDFYEK